MIKEYLSVLRVCVYGIKFTPFTVDQDPVTNELQPVAEALVDQFVPGNDTDIDADLPIGVKILVFVTLTFVTLILDAFT
jgi:hypothetical protein